MPSVSKKQHNFMAAVASNPKFAKKAGVPSAVGKEFLTADKGKTFKEGGTMKKMNPGMMAIMAKKKPIKMNGGGNGKMPMVMKNGQSVPAFAADGEGKMKKGGKVHSDIAKDKPMMKKVAAKAVKGHEKRLHGMAKGGGVEMKGKTKGAMIKMNKGGRSC
jgi:hypothetical protein